MLKAFWYFVPPVAILIHGHQISQTSCLATGFLLAAQIEASGAFFHHWASETS